MTQCTNKVLGGNPQEAYSLENLRTAVTVLQQLRESLNRSKTDVLEE